VKPPTKRGTDCGNRARNFSADPGRVLGKGVPGVDIIPVDIHPPTTDPKVECANHYCFTKAWCGIETMSALEAVRAHPDRTLMFCWPSFDEPWPAGALQEYRNLGGKTVVFIGEGSGGCTGDDLFHELLECWWEEVEDYRIPQWEGIHDFLSVLKPKEQ